MTLDKLKRSISYRVSLSKKIPNDEILADLVYEGCLYVLARCIPQILLCDSNADFKEKPFRKVDNGKFLAFPEYPDFNKIQRHLQIDESLTFAVINYVIFLITKEPSNKAICNEEIAMYCSNYSEEGYE